MSTTAKERQAQSGKAWRIGHYGPRTIEDPLVYLMALGAMPARPCRGHRRLMPRALAITTR